MLCSPAFAAHARSTLYNFVSTVHSFIKVHEVCSVVETGRLEFKKTLQYCTFFGRFDSKVMKILFNTNMLS